MSGPAASNPSASPEIPNAAPAFDAISRISTAKRSRRLDLGELGQRIARTVDEVRRNDYLLRFRVPPYELTVFQDGRAVIKGTRDPAVARSLYARYIGA